MPSWLWTRLLQKCYSVLAAYGAELGFGLESAQGFQKTAQVLLGGVQKFPAGAQDIGVGHAPETAAAGGGESGGGAQQGIRGVDGADDGALQVLILSASPPGSLPWRRKRPGWQADFHPGKFCLLGIADVQGEVGLEDAAVYLQGNVPAQLPLQEGPLQSSAFVFSCSRV